MSSSSDCYDMIKVSCFKYEDDEDDYGQLVVMYVILVEDARTESKHILHKRYSDFLELFTILRELSPEIDRYRFPNKSLFNNRSQFTLERRLEGFNDFLQIAVAMKPLPVQFELFLELKELLNDSINNERDQIEKFNSGNHDNHRSTPVNNQRTSKTSFVNSATTVNEKSKNEKNISSRSEMKNIVESKTHSSKMESEQVNAKMETKINSNSNNNNNNHNNNNNSSNNNNDNKNNNKYSNNNNSSSSGSGSCNGNSNYSNVTATATTSSSNNSNRNKSNQKLNSNSNLNLNSVSNYTSNSNSNFNLNSNLNSNFNSNSSSSSNLDATIESSAEENVKKILHLIGLSSVLLAIFIYSAGVIFGIIDVTHTTRGILFQFFSLIHFYFFFVFFNLTTSISNQYELYILFIFFL